MHGVPRAPEIVGERAHPIGEPLDVVEDQHLGHGEHPPPFTAFRQPSPDDEAARWLASDRVRLRQRVPVAGDTRQNTGLDLTGAALR